MGTLPNRSGPSRLRSNAFRLNIEWSRIFPNPTFGIEGYDNLRAIADQRAIDHYHAVFTAMHKAGLTPNVTLNHYTLPVWIHDGVGCRENIHTCSPRGWLDTGVTVREIAKFAGFVAREFGADVDLWVTENEPFSVILPGYLMPTPTRTNPPALPLKTAEFKTAMIGLIEAHARMYDAIKAEDQVDADGDGQAAQVGVIYEVLPVYPMDPTNDLDKTAAVNIYYLWNTVFLDATILGMLDQNLNGTPAFRDDLAGRMDFLGINYYGRTLVSGTKKSFLPSLSPLATFNPLTANYRDEYPRGIYEATSTLYDRYHIPMYITENNGGCDQTNDGDQEKRYLVEHMSWLWFAMQQGIDVRGYFFWSLIDNFEWNQGMGLPCGLYGIDRNDPLKTRTPRSIVSTFQEIARAHGVPPDLAAKYPVDLQ